MFCDDPDKVEVMKESALRTEVQVKFGTIPFWLSFLQKVWLQLN